MARFVAGFGLVCLLLGVVGCQEATGPAKTPPPPEVFVALPVKRQVTEYEYFTGKTDPFNKIDLRARVSGYLEKTFFIEGTVVEKDALLFRIDQRPYKVDLEKATANLASAKALASLAEGVESRGKVLLQQRAIAIEDYEKLVSDVRVGRANILVGEAALHQAQLNMAWTEVRAPFAGRISRWATDPGNLVKADDTILTTLVAVEPMYVLFDVDERTVLRQMIKNNLTQMPSRTPIKVDVGLVDEPGKYPHPAVINFVDNRLDSSTGSLWMRATLIKPNRDISPGMFSRIRFPLGPPATALCVAESALGTDQGQRFVFVVDDKNVVHYRGPNSKEGEPRLVVGRQHDGLRVIESGVEPGDRVVVSGLQRVRDLMKVTPKLEKMPGQPDKETRSQGVKETPAEKDKH